MYKLTPPSSNSGFFKSNSKPLNVELKLEVEDSPNSAGVAIDAIRCAKIALDKKVSGSIESASAYFMKSPSIQMRDDDARRAVEEFSDIK